jgi:hypothetical protein
MYPRIPFVRHGAINPARAVSTGVGLVVAGLLLTGIGALLFAYCLDFFTLSDIIPGVYRDPNAPPTKIPIGAFVFIGFIILFGLVSLLEGGWRICYRESNKYLYYIMLTMGAIFIAAGILAKGLK